MPDQLPSALQPPMRWDGWGDPALAAPLPEQIVTLLREALGVSAARTIAVDRDGYAGRVDAGAVGKMIIEQRGPTVVALG